MVREPRSIARLLAVLAVLGWGRDACAGCSDGNDLLPPIPVGSVSVTLEVAADVSGLITDITHAGDGSRRLFLVSPHGVIRILRGGSVLSDPFLNAPASPTDRAMSGLAFHPDFAVNGRLYVITGEATPNPSVPHYAPTQEDTPTSFDNVLHEYQVSTTNPDSVDPSSRRELLRVHQADKIHNMNDLAFGADGYLYIAMGDGGDTRTGSPTRFNTNAQLTTNPYGAILRIDVDTIGPNGRYGIPPDNPFASGAAGNVPEIFAWGFRNPWRISVDRWRGDVYVGENGYRTIEAIERVELGRNYGWDVKEGSYLWDTATGEATVDPSPDPQYTDPLAEYDHDNPGSVCFGSAIGGYVYRGRGRPELRGSYLFNDWVAGRLVRMDVTTGALEIVPESGGAQLSPSLDICWGESETGELYIGTAAGKLLRFRLDARNVHAIAPVPHPLRLASVRPNPTRGPTDIVFELRTTMHVELSIFDVAGRRVATLVAGRRGPGRHRLTWPKGTATAQIPAGVYRVVLRANGERESEALTLLR